MNSSQFSEEYGYEYEALLNELNLVTIGTRISFYASIVTTAIGLISEPITAIIYLSEEFRKKSFGTYFAAHSILDIIFLLSMLIFQVQPYLFPQYVLFCQITLFTQSVSQILTSWIQVTNSIDRVVLITMPKRMMFMRKLKFQFTVMIIIFILSSLLEIPNLTNQSQLVIDGTLYCVTIDDFNLFFYFISCIIIYLILPFFIMLMCSIIIICTLKRKGKVLNLKNDARKQRDNILTKTLLASNIYFLIVLLPYSIIAIAHVYLRTHEIIFFYFHQGQFVIIYYILLIPIQFYHATSVFVHVKFNSIFRKVIREFFFKNFKIKLYQDQKSL